MFLLGFCSVCSVLFFLHMPKGKQTTETGKVCRLSSVQDWCHQNQLHKYGKYCECDHPFTHIPNEPNLPLPNEYLQYKILLTLLQWLRLHRDK